MHILDKNQVLVFLGIACLCFAITPIAQAATKQIVITKGIEKVHTRNVILYFSAPEDTAEMKISNNGTLDDAEWEPYVAIKKWQLDIGGGEKRVYVRFKDAGGNESIIYKDDITLSLPTSMDVSIKINKDGDEQKTRSRYVTLDLSYSVGVEKVELNNEPTFDVEPQKLQERISWVLPAGSGSKTVYARFIDANGSEKVVQDSIEYIESPGHIEEGSLLKTETSNIYYLGFDGQIHPFLNSIVYHSWYKRIQDVVLVSPKKFQSYQVGAPVCMRGGTWLLRFGNESHIYGVGIGCTLFPLRSEVEAIMLYGPSWQDRLVSLSAPEKGIYQIKNSSVADADADIKDVDRDGVDADTERIYGSKDVRLDTDGDGLSDAEEILYWKTKPGLRDTDSDGINDLLEAKKLIESGEVPRNPEQFYRYPAGTVVRFAGSTNLYMEHISERLFSVGRNIEASVFTSNKFEPRYIVRTSPFFRFFTTSKRKLSKSMDILQYPTYTTDQATVLVY